jgi:hypothetical protein
VKITLYLQHKPNQAPEKVEVDIRPYLHDRIVVDGSTWTCTEVLVDYDAQEIRCKCAPFVPKAQSR